MKYIIICYALLLSSCLPKPFETPKLFIPYALDFTKYSQAGFLFTPLDVKDRAYESKGIIKIDGIPEVVPISEVVEYAASTGVKIKYRPVPVKSGEMIEQAYKLAVEMGANAIIQFRITSRQGMSDGHVPIEILEMNGFAIKLL